jgi:hypothetical protein
MRENKGDGRGLDWTEEQGVCSQYHVISLDFIISGPGY